MESTQSIPGRGGAALSLIASTDDENKLLLVAGASRDEQFDDFWNISVNRKTHRVSSIEKVSPKDLDEFTKRNGLTSVFSEGRYFIIGGQDSEKNEQFNDVYMYKPESTEFQKIEYIDGRYKPAVRNSHTMVKVGQKAFIFGGANTEGPLKDLCSLDLKTFEFKEIKLDESEVQIPMLEMHTANLYQGSKMLVMGGRGANVGDKEVGFQNGIFEIDLETGKVKKFGSLPADLASHHSIVIDDKYIVVYGGTNGFRFFDSITRYTISSGKWMLMNKIPDSCKSSRFFQDGRLASSCVHTDDQLIIFGGCSADKDCNDFLIVPIADLRNDENFIEINEIM